MATLLVISAPSVKQSLHASRSMDGSPMALAEGLESFDVDGVIPVRKAGNHLAGRSVGTTNKSL